MEIIGFERNNFTVRSTGTEVTGYNVYLARDINPDRGTGSAVERIYLSDRKIDGLGLCLADLVGCEVTVYYNRFGKPERIVPVD